MPPPVPYTSNGANGSQTSPSGNSYTTVEGNAQALCYAFAVVAWDGTSLTFTSLAPGITPTTIDLPVAADRVVTGIAATQDGTDKRKVNVAAGSYQLGGQVLTFAGGNVTSANGHASLPRLDLVTLNSSNALVLTPGTAAAQPTLPAVPAGELPIATVYVPAGATSVTTTIVVGDLKQGVVVALPVAATGQIPYSDGADYTTAVELSYDSSNRQLAATSVRQTGLLKTSVDSGVSVFDSLVIVDTSGGVVTVDLPLPADTPDGTTITIKRRGASNANISANTATFDDGDVATPYTLVTTGAAATLKFIKADNTWQFI